MRARIRLLRARLTGLVGMTRLLLALRRGKVEEIWVGDSHSVLLNTGRFPFPGVGAAAPGRWVIHLGPRVMYSIARDGFPPALQGLAARIGRLTASQRVSWFFVFGEIDIRCHLAPRLADGGDVGFVAQYVDHVRALTAIIGPAASRVVVPVPPCIDVLDHNAFPVAGSPEQRLAAHRAVREALHAAAADTGDEVGVLDMTPALMQPDGLMQPQFTDDGCHTNAAGRAVVRRETARLTAARR